MIGSAGLARNDGDPNRWRLSDLPFRVSDSSIPSISSDIGREGVVASPLVVYERREVSSVAGSPPLGEASEGAKLANISTVSLAPVFAAC